MSRVKHPRTKIVGGLLAAVIAAGALAACGQSDSDGASSGAETPTFKVAASPENPITHGLVSYVADVIAPDYGIEIEVEDIADVRQQNESLDKGDIDASAGQNKPYLEVQKAEGGYKISAVQPIYLFNLAGYSKKHSSVDDLPDGAKVGIHADPANEAQDLYLLANQGIIEVDESVDPAELTVKDVTSNPKKLKFELLEGAQIVRVLDELDLGLVYAYVVEAAGVSDEYSLFSEQAQPTYASQLIVRDADKDKPEYKKLVEAFADERVAKRIEEEFSFGASPVPAS